MRHTVLNDIETQYYYDQLLYLTTSKQESVKERAQGLHLTFLSLLNNLTEDREQQIFSGWFAKLHFICQAYGLGEEWELELQGMRRFLRRNSLQKFFNPSEKAFISALARLTRLVQLFATQEAPQSLSSVYQEQLESKQLISFIYKENPPKVTPWLFGTLQEKDDEIITDEHGKGTTSFVLKTENFGEVSISVADVHYYSKNNEVFRRHNLSREVSRLMRYQSLALTNLEWVEELAEESEENRSEEHRQDALQFMSTDKTLIILSPDYLVDASAIARCRTRQGQTPYLYLLSKLEFFEGNEGTFRGKVINEMLDMLVENPELTFEDGFRASLSQNSIDAAFIEEHKLKAIREELKGHFLVVQKYITPYYDKILTTEPSFISSKYGLQGRIDLLVEHPSEPNAKNEAPLRKDIIELKSSKAPNSIMANGWKNDLLQVACYNMLIDSTFYKRSGISALLYSSDHETGLRDCGNLDFEKQTAMSIRNRIVTMDRWIATANQKVFDNLLQAVERSNPAPFSKEKALHFNHKWTQATDLDRAYFTEYMALVTREMMYAKVGGLSGAEPAQGFASLWKNSLQDKQGSFAILDELTFLGWDKSECLITLKRPDSMSITAFRKGDIIVLYPLSDTNHLTDEKDSAGSIYSAPLRQQILKGNIEEISAEEVTLRIWSKHIDESFFGSFHSWSIEPNLMERTFGDLTASLAEFLGANANKKELIYGKAKPSFEEEFEIDYRPEEKGGLSEEQNQILNRALSAKDYFLLQGPPGTGKTSKMLRNMVDYLYKHTSQIIVLLAFTNRATEEICQKVKSVCGDDFVKLGSAKEGDEFFPQSLKSAQNLGELKAKIHRSRVFVSTVSSFYSHLRILDRKDEKGLSVTFDTLIVDEASQLLEPHLCGILPKFKRFILIGDEKQLPAVVTQPSRQCKAKSPLLHEVGISDLSQSVFERLVENAMQNGWHQAYAMLQTQFRTHQDIAEFISTEFYKTLRPGSQRQHEALHYYNPNSEDENERFLSQGRVLFVPTTAERGNKYHPKEADKVVELVRTIARVFGDSFDSETVGVITPYRAQIAQIYQRMEESLRNRVSVDTVERYQGSERKIIILSVATNYAAQMRFLECLNSHKTVDKKLNVALSRAKEQLILLGNPNVLQAGKFYGKFLKWLEEKHEAG